jgi:hypothetical protein
MQQIAYSASEHTIVSEQPFALRKPGLNSLDHLQDEFEALQLTENFCLKAKWQSVAIGCAQSLEPPHPFGMHGFIVIDTVDGEESFNSVDMLDTFVDWPATFAVKPTNSPHQLNLYPVGIESVPRSLLHRCEGTGLQGDGTHLNE